MTITAGPSASKMQREKGKSPGWAAFACKQQQKQGIEPELGVDPYPPISNLSFADRHLMANHGPPMRPFSSVVRSSVPPLVDNSRRVTLHDNSSREPSDQIAVEANAIQSVKRLKYVYSWADDSLIEDILAAVNNNEEQASSLLKDMVLSDFKGGQDSPGPSSVFEDHLFDEKNKCSSESISLGNKLSDGVQRELMLPHLFSAPVEPEWVEDDVYLSHRKDAIRMMRVASQHSRAASNAFLRGDHFSAHQLSLKAREEWMEAEKLNAKAAEEILSIRNNNNDVWKLDLHGLHASEAVDALKEHLHRIELQLVINRSASSDGIAKLAAGIVRSPSLESVSVVDVEAQANKQQALSQQKQTVLHVITGTGNHSRGQAALPTAIRSFLVENEYHFDDARAGVIAVRPKFRHR